MRVNICGVDVTQAVHVDAGVAIVIQDDEGRVAPAVDCACAGAAR